MGANKLEARRIKETLTEIAGQMKSFGGASWKNEDDPRRSKGSRQGDNYDEKKEAIVIWGSLEIPKLFSCSHQSTKLLKTATLFSNKLFPWQDVSRTQCARFLTCGVLHPLRIKFCNVIFIQCKSSSTRLSLQII